MEYKLVVFSVKFVEQIQDIVFNDEHIELIMTLKKDLYFDEDALYCDNQFTIVKKNGFKKLFISSCKYPNLKICSVIGYDMRLYIKNYINSKKNKIKKYFNEHIDYENKIIDKDNKFIFLCKNFGNFVEFQVLNTMNQHVIYTGIAKTCEIAYNNIINELMKIFNKEDLNYDFK